MEKLILLFASMSFIVLYFRYLLQPLKKIQILTWLWIGIFNSQVLNSVPSIFKKFNLIFPAMMIFFPLQHWIVSK